MKDFISKYKKHTFFQNSAIVITSLAIALGINTYILDWQIWKYIKSSVLDIHGVKQTADIYGRVSDDRKNIILGTQKPMKNVKSISFSFSYDSENIKINDIKSILSETSTTSLSNEPGITTLLITFNAPKNLKWETDFLSLDISKNTSTTAYLNIFNANFRDVEDNNFLLSTSWIMF